MAKPKKTSGKSTTTKLIAKIASARKSEKVRAKKGAAAKTISTADVQRFEAAGHQCGGYDPNHPFRGFFKRKGDPNETILTIFRNKRIWGALLAEAIGTMLVSMLLLAVGMYTAVLYAFFVGVAISAATVALSGAHLNPIITAGMMASRRVSAIRGVLYILAQVIGAWLGFMVVNTFLLAGGSEYYTLSQMEAVTADTFWGVFFLELVGALIIGYLFSRAWRYHRKQPLVFAIIVASGIALPFFLCYLFAGYLGFSVSSYNYFIFNPAIALMYQILPSSADSFSELMQLMGMALTTYVIVPLIGGIAGNYLGEATSRLAGEKPVCGCRPHPAPAFAAEEVIASETKTKSASAKTKKSSKSAKKTATSKKK